MEHGILNGIIIEENEEISLLELCQICKVDTEWVTALVHEGILEPVGAEPEHWFFSGVSLRRVLIVNRLQHDLDINLAGAALVVRLLEERDALLAKTNL
ncbi:transcriptional regulator, MerR family [Nitrosomonas eutropha]|uniref:Transcriptional regulator, MerR family n=1 Tax=Nitrosomonas eutropha TaxID=916 RepID=A0A1I7G2K7_9PROT|nr:chaperone modulator CbpM [Nitrosomonas eutropha]SFU42677.1 transcriptional regulator, MerR family [Nitrosomonas eutropha]